MSDGELAMASTERVLPGGRKKKKKPQASNREGVWFPSLWHRVVEAGAVRTASLFIHLGPRQERIKNQFENLRVTLGLCGLGTAGST